MYKRNTMFYFIILIISWACINCENDLVMIKQYQKNGNNNYKYYCIANSSFPLSMFNSRKEVVFHNVSQFYPKSQVFNPGVSAVKWSSENSLTGNINEIILDRRWEELRLLETTKTEADNKTLKYVNAASLNQTEENRIVFPFSLKIKNEAHVFLCNGTTVSKSECYWFTLQDNEGKSVLRKCPYGTVPLKDNEFPKSSCKYYKYNDTNGNYLNNKKWSHFKLSKTDKNLKLVRENKQKEFITIIDYEDNDKPFSVQHVLIHSKNKEKGLWKIHEIEYFFTNEISDLQVSRINSRINKVNNFTCLSMFVYMCDTCNLTLELKTEDDSTSIKKQSYQHKSWTEIKFFFERTQKSMTLLISNTRNNSGEKGFLAIGKTLRTCQKKEFRYVTMTSNENVQCELVSYKQKKISSEEIIENTDNNYCPANTIGKLCVPCFWCSFKNCEQLNRTKLCENYNESKYCVCLNKDDKSMPCEVPDKPEKLTYSKPNNSSIRLEWLPPKFFNGKFEDYIVQIKQASIECDQQICNNSRTNVREAFAKIENVIPYSNYSFTVFARNSKRDGIPSSINCQTPFSENISKDEIPNPLNITTDARNIKINFSTIDCCKFFGPLFIKMIISCQNEWCRGEKSIVVSKKYNYTKPSFAVDKLKPFTNYRIEFHFSRKINDSQINTTETFRTNSAAPNDIKHIVIYSKNDSSVSIRCKPPYPPTGTLHKYQVDYYLDYYTDQDTDVLVITKQFSVDTTITCELWRNYHCITLTNLQRNSNYTIQIKAKNQEIDYFGQLSRSVAATTIIEPSEAPYDLQIHWTLTNSLQLSWKHPNVTNGLILCFNITLIFKQSEKKSVNKTVHENMNIISYNMSYQYLIDVSKILASAECNISVSAYNGLNGKKILFFDTTPPNIPSFKSEPQINLSEKTIEIDVTINDDPNNGNLYLLVSGNKIKSKPQLIIPQILKNLKMISTNFQLLYECNIKNLTYFHFNIGKNKTLKNCNKTINYYLNPMVAYNVTIILTSTFKNKTRFSEHSYIVDIPNNNIVTYKNKKTQPQTSESNNLILLTLLLFLIPIAIFIYWKKHVFISQWNSLRRNRSNIVEYQEIPLTGTKNHSKRVKITDLEEYVKESIRNGEFARQHSLFPPGQTMPWSFGALEKNKSKNRYKNLIAYDHTRVILKKDSANDSSDYINANYIDSYNVFKAYIATQGPKKSTIHDFWYMIWQENVHYIVMLANLTEGGKKKVEKYWPEIHFSLSFGDINVYHSSNKVFPYYEHRTFQVTRAKQTRTVEHFHFVSWPDHGIPLYPQSLVPFLQELLKLPLSSKSPVVVHCSGGVGRTGTILLCDISLRMAESENAVDLLRHLQILRNQRPNMVDNVEQYKLAHLVVLHYLLGKDTGIPCNKIEKTVNELIETQEIEEQMNYLEKLVWLSKAAKIVFRSKDVHVVKKKNRFQEIVPEPQGCVYLSRYPSTDNDSTYINAVTVDGYRSPEKFIVTQQPLPNTVGDFWRLVYEKEVLLVVSLNEVEENDPTSCPFWPTGDSSVFTPVDWLTLRHANTFSCEHYDIIKVEMIGRIEDDRKVVEIMNVKRWFKNRTCPDGVEDFLVCINCARDLARKAETIVVTCYDGATASGLYVAMDFIIEKMELEQIYDVCQAVGIIRRNRSQLVRNEEQLLFLYQAAVAYIKNFQLYANYH